MQIEIQGQGNDEKMNYPGYICPCLQARQTTPGYSHSIMSTYKCS